MEIVKKIKIKSSGSFVDGREELAWCGSYSISDKTSNSKLFIEGETVSVHVDNLVFEIPRSEIIDYFRKFKKKLEYRN